jgi:phosphopantothenoylcysteine decarboxylase/phosphopantothenate--cysteine ligase
MQLKNLDMIVLNNPLEKGAGFRKDTNEVILFHKSGKKLKLPIQAKIDVARKILTFLINKGNVA